MNNGAHEKQSLSHKIVRNTLYNTLGRFWGILVGLFLTPYIIDRIGVERFGIWALAGVLTGYFGLIDFGVGSSFVKYISEFYTKREYEKINKIVATGFTLYFLFAVIGIVLIMILMGPILTVLNIPAHLRHETALVFIIGITLFGAANTLSPFGAMQSGLQRMDISNRTAIVLSIFNIAGTIYFLEKGYGLVGLMINNTLVFIMAAVINIVFAFRIFPQLKFKLFYFDRDTFNRLFRFGYKMQIAKVSAMITNQVDKILIAFFLSIGLVTFYQLGSSIVYYTVSLAAVLTSALMPAFSEIDAKGDRPRLIEAYLRSVKYFAFFIAPLFMLLIVSASDIVFIWLGYGFERSIAIIRILAFAFMVNTIAQVPASVSVSIDKPQLMAVGSVIIIVLNIVLSAFLIKIFGFFGAAWGTLLAVNIGTAYFLFQLHASLSISMKRMAGIILPYIASSCIAASVVFAIDMIIMRSGFMAHSGRIEALTWLSLKVIVFLAVYIACLYRLKWFDPMDVAALSEKVPIVGPMIKRIFMRT